MWLFLVPVVDGDDPDRRCLTDSRAGALRRWGRLAPHRGIGQVRPRRLSLAAKLGLVPLGLGGVLGHHRLVEPLLDIAAEAVRGQVGEVEGLYRPR